MDERIMFIRNQVSAEILGVRLLNNASKQGKHVALPNIEDSARRWSKYYDRIEESIDKLDSENEQ